MLKTLWNSSDLNFKTKVDMLVFCMFSRLLYAAETWTMRAADSRKLIAFEMRCYRRILKVCWKDRVTNKSVRDKVERPHIITDLIKQKKLKVFGYIMQNERSETGED